MNEKEKWITEVEKSINRIEAPEVNPYLYSKILNRINTNATDYISNKLVVTGICSLIILLTVNIFIFKSFDKNSASPSNDLVKVSKAFHLVNENDINYN